MRYCYVQGSANHLKVCCPLRVASLEMTARRAHYASEPICSLFRKGAILTLESMHALYTWGGEVTCATARY